MIRLAWKNIWRNKVRSGVILSAIAIGLSSGTFLSAFLNGWIIGTVNNDIETQISHIQIHDTAFLANYDINAFFEQAVITPLLNVPMKSINVSVYFPSESDKNFFYTMECSLAEQRSLMFKNNLSLYEVKKMGAGGCPLLSTLKTENFKTAFRLHLVGMLASPHNALGVTVKGVFPDEERQVTDVWKHIPDTMGVYLTDDTRNAIVISRKIADKLKVRLRSRIVFTFQDAHGDMQSIAFRVGGIYKTTNGMFDEGNVFVRYDDVFSYTGLPQGAVHEAAILLPDLKASSLVTPQLKRLFPDFDVRDWSEINPSLTMVLAYTNFMSILILGIFLLALSFGIINTMLMAVLERTRELGMLGAIGMSKGKIFNMIMLETIFLALLGSMVGILLGTAFVVPSLENGINLAFFIGDQFEDFGFSSIVYPIINAEMFVEILILVIVAGILSAIYPARKALKLKPLDAIRD